SASAPHRGPVPRRSSPRAWIHPTSLGGRIRPSRCSRRNHGDRIWRFTWARSIAGAPTLVGAASRPNPLASRWIAQGRTARVRAGPSLLMATHPVVVPLCLISRYLRGCEFPHTNGVAMRFLRSSLGRVFSAIRSRPWSSRPTARGWAAVAAAAAVLTLVGIVASSAPGPRSGAASGLRSPGRARASSGRAGTASRWAGHRSGRSGTRADPAASAASTGEAGAGRLPRTRTAARQAGSGLRTSCRRVAHIGDSTSVDLISSADLPDPAERLPARYTDVGVRHLLMDASGGRSIVEALPGQVNGYNVAQAWWSRGHRGSSRFALGANDAANVSVGAAVGPTGRIDEMMSVAHGEPVLWVNSVTELSGGPWSEANEQLWDAALAGALARYPNMRILNWAAVARPGWFLPDGIHYNPV